jgi:hypothetical protein
MSASPVIALRKAIRSRLLADAELVSALGGPKIYDEAQRGVDPPYGLFAETQLRDWSGELTRGAEQLLTIAVVTTQRGLGVALGVAQQIVDILNEAPLALERHSLIDLRFVSLETRRDQNGRFARVSILFRATTEYL